MHAHRALPWLACFAAICLGARASADELRNVKVGDLVPEYELPSLAGGTVTNPSKDGKSLLLVYISAQQTSSEKAAIEAHDIAQQFRPQGLELHLVTADAVETSYFRAQRDKSNIHEPLGLDIERKLYGDLGLIVLPTTILVDSEGRLKHVVSGHKSDYSHVVKAYVRHTLGQIDDARLEEELSTEFYRRDAPEARAARHRAAAELLREKGLFDQAEQELRSAIEIVPEDMEIRIDLALLLVAQDQVDNAAAIVQEVFEKDPQNRRATLARGIIRYHQDQLDEAEADLTQALLLNPDPARTHYYLGLVYEKKGDKDKAINHYREALRRLLHDG